MTLAARTAAAHQTPRDRVTSTLRSSSLAALDRPPGALTTIAEVAALLAAAEPPSEAVAGVLRMTARAMGAEGVTLWLQSPRGLIRSHTTEHDPTTASAMVQPKPGSNVPAPVNA